MSFFRQQKTCINDESVLLKTLEELGFKAQVNEKKVIVRGHGTETNKAEIILRKEDLKDGGDIGFSRDKDGNFEIIGDTYVLRTHKLEEFTKKVNLKYGENKARAIAKKNGWSVVKSQEITTNGNTIQRLQFVVA